MFGVLQFEAQSWRNVVYILNEGNEEGEYPKRFLGTGFIAIDSALDVFDLDY